jgi:ubiquinone/menaquinone biosynthesis C-methylase UbiE
LTFDGKLSFAPFDKIHRVLDVGTGTGIWAINFGESAILGRDQLTFAADEHPEAQVQ